MKTTLTVLAVLFLVALIYYRQRIYVRDPLASVYRDDVKQEGVQVFINYSNDVLLEQDSPPTPTRILIQDWNKTPGTPMSLTCLHWLACFTDSDRTSTIPLVPTAQPAPQPPAPSRRGAASPARPAVTGKYDPKVFMTGHEILFTAPDNSAMRIELH
jgi:hypothetical protein